MDAPREVRPARRRRLVITYALIVGAVAGILRASTIDPVGLSGGMDTGAALYLASAGGVLVGWWALHNTMGGPT